LNRFSGRRPEKKNRVVKKLFILYNERKGPQQEEEYAACPLGGRSEMIQIKELFYILTIAREGSISRAAEKLYLSQPALSQFLKNYEDALGSMLFYRTPKGVRLTYAGEQFVAAAESMEEIYSGMLQQMAQKDDVGESRLSFGIPAAKSALFLPDILKGIHVRYPQIHLSILEENSEKLEQMLADGKLDMALISTPLNDPRIKTRPIASEEVLLAVAVGHPILRKSSLREDGSGGRWVDPAGISGENYILLEKGCKLRKLSDQVFQALGIRPHVSYSVGNTQVAVEMAAKGLGLTVISSSRKDPIEGLTYLSLGESGVYRDVVMAYSDTAYHSKTAGILTDEVYTVVRRFLGS
jgi:DNA-binding transcriptional LysR family regulator